MAVMRIPVPTIVALSCGVLIAIACAPSSSTPAGGRASGLITAANGGVIKTPGGVVLEVPPGAVTSDVVITVIPLDAAASGSSSVVAGARFEPDGLTLKKAATLRLPYESGGRDAPIELVFRGDAPGQAFESGVAADVSDGHTAVLQVWHFSGNICAKNCHGGTREFLSKQLTARGTDLTACVTAKYPDSLPARCEDIHSEEAVQAILGTFFDEVPSCCDEGQDVGSAQMQVLLDAIKQGRNVVVAFMPHAFGERGGGKVVGGTLLPARKDFYPAMNHTAAVEVVGGVPMLRNTVVIPGVGGAQILEKLGGTNLVYWPLSDINTFRKMKAAEGLERAACGEPGCLDNEHGGPFNPLETRPVPWSAVRLFVERSTAPGCGPMDAGVDAMEAGPPVKCPPPEKCPTSGSPDQTCPEHEYCAAGDAGNACQRHCCWDFELDAGTCNRPGLIPHSVVGVGEGEYVYCTCLAGYTAVNDACYDLVRCDPK